MSQKTDLAQARRSLAGAERLRTGKGHPGRWRAKLWRDRWLIILGLPGLAVTIIFYYVPLLGNVIAFQDYQPYLGILDSPWVGFQNFTTIFDGNPEFLNALSNTLIISLLQVAFVFPIPIAIALLLNSLLSQRIRLIVQSILYLPHFMSWVLVVAIFDQLLGPVGLLNNFLAQHQLTTVSIIGNAAIFKELVTAQVIWKDTGWSTILFFAALSSIDTQLYEAASVDGASRSRQLWHVTLPGIVPMIVLVLILRLGAVLSVGFEQILLQQPSVGIQASEVLDTYVYNNGIVAGNWGVSAAVNLVKGVVAVVLVYGANRAAHLFGQRGIYQS